MQNEREGAKNAEKCKISKSVKYRKVQKVRKSWNLSNFTTMDKEFWERKWILVTIMTFCEIFYQILRFYYFYKNVKFRKIPDFSPRVPSQAWKSPHGGILRKSGPTRFFFSPRGVQKIAISKIDSTNLLIMVIDNLENKKCYA